MDRPRVLPRFHGYTVDVELGEFRRADDTLPLGMEFVPFDSRKGQHILHTPARTAGAGR
jgi:hypothetical protein